MKAARVILLKFGQLNMFLLKPMPDISGGVELKVEEKARCIRALWVAGSRATGGWCFAKPSLAF